MFFTVIIIKNRKIKNIEDGIKQAHKLYMKLGLKTTFIHADSEFEPLLAEMDDIDISLNWKSKKEDVPEIEIFNQTVKERVLSD